MLTSFSVQNFKGFEKKITFDLSRPREYAFNTDTIRNGTISKAMVYGYNGTGKTNLGHAMFDIVKTLTTKWSLETVYKNYLNSLHKEELAEFEYKFKFGNVEVEYAYGKNSWADIIYECLKIGGAVVAQYDKRDEQPPVVSLRGAEKLIVDKNSLSISLVRFINANSIRQPDDSANLAFDQLILFVENMLMYWSLDDRGFIGLNENSTRNVFSVICQPEHWTGFKELLAELGLGNVEAKEENGEKVVYFVFENGSTLEFFANCSSGTKAVVIFYFWMVSLQDKTRTPSLLFVDEFSAFYHNSLANTIVKLVKKLDWQVIMTTHNSALMTNELFRPDCLFLLYRDSITSLADRYSERELREGNNLEKMYRSGVFDNA